MSSEHMGLVTLHSINHYLPQQHKVATQARRECTPAWVIVHEAQGSPWQGDMSCSQSSYAAHPDWGELAGSGDSLKVS